MPNTNFVPNWTFERTLPFPFDSYSGKSAVMKDIASKYCNQPKKPKLAMLWRICCGKNQVADLLFQLVKTEESLKTFQVLQ